MALPVHVDVRISSEAAGAISLTPVVNRTMDMRDLMEVILGATGKDGERVGEILSRGSVVQGASRFRWKPIVGARTDIDAVLATFPDADPKRGFNAQRCIGVRIRAERHLLELPRELAAARRFLRRRSFWDALMAIAARSKLEYTGYSYRMRSDEYRLTLTAGDSNAICQAAALLKYTGLVKQVQQRPPDTVEYSVRYPQDPA